MHIARRKLTDAMNRAGITSAQQQTVLELLKEGLSGKVDDGYASLLHKLSEHRRTISTNMSNRNLKLRPMYEEYLVILDKIKERIEIARTHGTLDQATAAAAEANEKRKLEGRPPGPDNASTWQSWVPPHIKVAFGNRTEQAYAALGRIKGNRFTPFIPATAQRAIKKSANILSKTLERLSVTHSHIEGQAAAYTPYRALYLCAARMAERELTRRMKAYEIGTANPVDNPLPVNWLALLDAPMRARLRGAQENPAGVSAEGLEHFLIEPPAGVRETFDAVDREHAAKQEIPDAPV